MTELLTLLDAKNDRGLETITGVCPDNPVYLKYLNEATRSLMRRGDWFGLLVSAQFCTQDNCVVWPAWVGAIRAINVAKHPIPIRNNWYEFLRFGPGTIRNGSLCCRSDYVAEQRGTTPVFKNISCAQGRYVRAYPRCQADIGKTITIYGDDTNGQEVLVKQADGTWAAGMTLTLALPFVSTSTQFRRVTRVRKDVTQCPVDVYQYDPVANVLEDMAHYTPSQTNPSYIFSALSGITAACGSCNTKNVDVLAKMAYVPLKDDVDLLPIQNLEALKKYIEGIKMGEAQNIKGQLAKEADAVHELNLADRDLTGDDSTPVEVATFGSARLEYKRVGRMI